MKKKNKKNIHIPVILAGIFGLIIGVGGAFLSGDQHQINGKNFPQIGIGGGPVEQSSVRVENTISGWPAKSQQVASEIINRYGQPDDITENQLLWGKNFPWKKIVVYREGIDSDLPGTQPKVLEQIINYSIPDDVFVELVAYNSSVSADKNKGELTARSDSEAMNFLVINLANDIIADDKSIDQARREYSNFERNYNNSINVPYTQKLHFNVPPAGKVRGPNETIMQ